MKYKNKKIEKRVRRHQKIRTQISGTAERPRLSVFKSNRYLYAQVIDDTKGMTLVAFLSKVLPTGTPRERAIASGKKIAELAKAKGITAVVFDRGGFRYQGSIQSFADAAREGGLMF